jgi:hypothetical protein
VGGARGRSRNVNAANLWHNNSTGCSSSSVGNGNDNGNGNGNGNGLGLGLGLGLGKGTTEEPLEWKERPRCWTNETPRRLEGRET